MDFRNMGKVTALILPLCLAACHTVRAGGLQAETLASSSEQPSIELRDVPPNGIDTLNQSDFGYFQTMGPLEYAARLGGVPDVPVWRVRLRFYPTWQNSELVYQVQVDHYNLSSTLYNSLISSYGVDNVDPSLDNTTPHQHLSLEFLPVMNVAADWLPDSTQTHQSDVTTNPICGLGLGCTALEEPDESAWTNETTLSLETAPWDQDNEPLYMMVRALAKKAGWLPNGWVLPNEIPEGINTERPWVEVLITNYAGNGGGYMAQWIEHMADDSVRATVHQLYYDSAWMEMEGSASTGYICGRQTSTEEIRALCP